VAIARKTLRWDPAVRAAAGKDDCAASYFASHVPSEMLPQLGIARDLVERRFNTSDGLIRADYLIAPASNNSPSEHRRPRTSISATTQTAAVKKRS